MLYVDSMTDKSSPHPAAEGEADLGDTDHATEQTDSVDEVDEKADIRDHDAGETSTQAPEVESPKPRTRRFAWNRRLTHLTVAGVALILTLAGAYLKWVDGSARLAQTAAVTSVQAATESTIAMLSYRPDTVEKELTAAGDRMTGSFRQEYAKLIHDVVIPGAKQKKIAAIATVPAAASQSATASHATVLVFVNQTIMMGGDPPTDTASSVRITLDKVNDRWLISQFTPV